MRIVGYVVSSAQDTTAGLKPLNVFRVRLAG